jgi:hypothetical protein
MPIVASQTIFTPPIRVILGGWLVRGYCEAHDRFLVASQQIHSPETLYIPLFEALNWIGCIEEKQRPHTDPLLSAIRLCGTRSSMTGRMLSRVGTFRTRMSRPGVVLLRPPSFGTGSGELVRTSPRRGNRLASRTSTRTTLS